MTPSRITDRRARPKGSVWQQHAILVLAIALLLGGVAFLIWPSNSPVWRLSPEMAVQLESACWRIGPLCLLIWLAYPEIQRIPLWFFGALPLTLIILWKRPQLIWILAPVAILVALLKPRKPGNRRA